MLFSKEMYDKMVKETAPVQPPKVKNEDPSEVDVDQATGKKLEEDNESLKAEIAELKAKLEGMQAKPEGGEDGGAGDC